MIPLVLGAVVLAGVWWLSGTYAKADPKALARFARRTGGWIAFAVAGLLLVRGRLDMAVFLGLAGAWLLDWHDRLPGRLGAMLSRWGSGRAEPRVSRVRSAALEMELDHATGAMRGTVLAGPHAGRALDALPLAALTALRRVLVQGDPDGARLLEAYLDRRAPRWRDDVEPDGDPGPGRAAHPGTMTEEEAYQILGLLRGAPAEEIRRAHRTLMKRLHPDQGGSDYLAARVNAAKDVLLNRHR